MTRTLTILLLAAVVTAINTSRCGKKAHAEDPGGQPAVNDSSFRNPILSSGPDPWVVRKDGYYYYMHTLANRIAIWKTDKMSQLSKASITTVWSPSEGAPHSKNIWAPELHFLNGKWYIYYTAGEGDISTQRIYVLENTAADPTQGAWTEKGKIYDKSADLYAIDGTVMENYNGHDYFIWSGNPSATDNKQCIYISRMSDPWTLETPRVLISAPQYEWETRGAPPAVNEGPEILKNSQGRVFLVYSASACWTDDYTLGLLSLKEGGDPLDPADWIKTPQPVFLKNAESGAYGPGHNGFFKSPDGKEDWILYHANSLPGQGCKDNRNPRIQRFTWKQDGTPDFGTPVKINVPMAVPSGE
ncbi:MAG: glycoside hydrolase family 43 protein [Chitinophagaceae bacterium]|nr:glycoside hydrolase family 43 protein [Chitinophagaceae bacterium]